MGGFSVGMLKDYVDIFVFAVLGVASFLALWFAIERVIFYSKVDLKAYDDIDALNLDLTKNLTILYVIFSNAPYVGLLGTVLGIMVIFYDMGVSGGMDAKTIMVGLSLALKATALGLAVSFFFNDTATTEIYTLSLHDALPIYEKHQKRRWAECCPFH